MNWMLYLLLPFFLQSDSSLMSYTVSTGLEEASSETYLSPFDEAVQKILDQTQAPGAALAVAYEGRLVLKKGYGFADMKASESVKEDALFRIASVSKPITAAAILTLVEKDRLSLDDKLTDLIDLRPQRGVRMDARISQITVRELLYHSGGWDRALSFDPMFSPVTIAVAMGEEPPASSETIVRYMLGQPLDFDPGSRQAYSNLGYAILGRIIEAVTDERYEDYVMREVFQPAGIRSMQLGRSLLEHQVEGEVRYHDTRKFPAVFSGLGVVPAPYGAFSIEAMDAHGGWVASAPDLLRFLTAVDANPSRPDILQRETIGKMVSPHPSAEKPFEYYAMGWDIMKHDNNPVWFHRGDLPGTTALLACAGKVQFAILLNGNAGSRENAEQILPSLLDAAKDVNQWPDVDFF